MRKAALFDLDGTLTDTLQDLTNICNATMRDFGYPVHTKEEVRMFVGDGVRKLCERALPEGVSLTEEHMTVIKKHYGELQNIETKIFPGVLKALKELKKMGIRLAVITNKPNFAAREVVPHYFGEGFFDYVVGEQEGLKPKPAPDLPMKAMREMELSPEDCFYFGDSDTDVMTAKNAGLPSYSVLWGYRDYELLKSAGTDGFIKDPGEIVELFKNS